MSTISGEPHNATYVFTANVILYAQWAVVSAPVTATVTFNANGGLGTMSPQTENLNASAALTTNTFTYSGYTFSGWNTAANGSGTGFTDSELVQFTASATFYAQWTAVSTIPASDYGPQGQNYQTYGNVYPADLGDCTFAAAANWEQIILGANPDPTVIGYEFSQAGGSATDGLTMTALFNYWYQYGIAGYYLHGYNSYYTSQVNVENGVLDYTAMVAVLQFVSGDYIGNQQVTAGGHVVVVDGYTSEGPLVVTWGTTIQMSWQQWNAEVTAMYGINASSTPN